MRSYPLEASLVSINSNNFLYSTWQKNLKNNITSWNVIVPEITLNYIAKWYTATITAGAPEKEVLPLTPISLVCWT